MKLLRNPLLRTLLVVCVAATFLAACSESKGPSSLVPVEISPGTSCTLDGMLLADYPGPKAQIHYANQAEPEFFCDTVEMFAQYLQPEQVRQVRAMFVQDMGKADWNEPRGEWIDAKSAWYVHGSSRHGSMGPTIASFALEADAQKFAAEHGGKVLAFTDVTPDAADLTGGATHDQSM